VSTPLRSRVGFVIRSARAEEFSQIGEITLRGFGHGKEPGYEPTAERRRLLLDVAARAESGDVLVAEDEGGRLIGTASLLRPGSAVTRQSDGEEAELRLLATLPGERGRGVGTALVLEALQRAREWGTPALVLDTGPDNDSQNIYARLGFTRVVERETQLASRGGFLVVFRHQFTQESGQ